MLTISKSKSKKQQKTYKNYKIYYKITKYK